MTNTLTDKTKVVICKLGDFWVNDKEARNIMSLKMSDADTSFEIDGCIIDPRTIDGILTADKYNELNYKRRGAWQCRYRFWHERGQQCAHERYNTNV